MASTFESELIILIMSENSDTFMIGDIQISPQHNTMTRGDFSCRLQPKAMALLHYLYKNSERVIGNDELLEHVWEGRVVTHNSIQKSINALRAAFAEFDTNYEYIAYFSKRGYQLVTLNNNKQNKPRLRNKLWSWRLILSVLLVVTTTALYLANDTAPTTVKLEPKVSPLYISQFTQVKPYISNTGRERIIEPYTSSERVAFIRDEPVTDDSTQSRLYIQGANGQEWQVSVARGQFVDLAWSVSGRNLVALEAHATTGEIQATNDTQTPLDYYTFHIFTLDFKGEKLIEKNLLSHWLGKVSSVTWWDEGTLEFVASQGTHAESTRYHYNIAEQNLVELDLPSGRGQLLASQLLNKVVAELHHLDSGVQIQFFSQQQKLMAQRDFPFQIVSMSWMADGSGLLLLSDAGLLLVLYTDGSLQEVNYAPKVGGHISRARSTDSGKSLVLTVDTAAQQALQFDSQYNMQAEGAESAVSFLAKGGGFIYAATVNK